MIKKSSATAIKDHGAMRGGEIYVVRARHFFLVALSSEGMFLPDDGASKRKGKDVKREVQITYPDLPAWTGPWVPYRQKGLNPLKRRLKRGRGFNCSRKNVSIHGAGM